MLIRVGQPLLFCLGLILTYLSLPNPLASFPFTIFFCFIPLFILNNRFEGIKLLFINVGFFEALSLFILIPLNYPGPKIILFGILVLISVFSFISLLCGCFLTLSTSLSNTLGWEYSPLFYGAGWVCSQYLLEHLPFAFPFPLETALTPFSVFLQSANIFGAYAISFLIIFTNSTLAVLIYGKLKKDIALLLAFILFGLHLLNVSYGIYSMSNYSVLHDKTRISFIQPNISLSEYANDKLPPFNLNKRMLSLTKKAVANKTTLVAWPEQSGNYIW